MQYYSQLFLYLYKQTFKKKIYRIKRLYSLGPLIEKAPHLPVVVLTNTNYEHLALEYEEHYII